MIIKLDINDRAALAIKNHEKRVEIRANDNKYDYSKLNSNDIIEFNSNNIGIFYVKVKEVNFYNSLEELFMLEGTRYTTSSTNDKDEAIKNVEKIGDYKESIKQNGVYAIHIEYLYSENTVWEEMADKARSVMNRRDVSGMISAGSVGAAILTENHNIYVGTCIDTASSLGMCGERNAIANMITNGESQIDKVVAVMPDGRVGSPCGACREYMMQLDKDSGDIEILLDLETQKTVRLRELIPDWWGYDRMHRTYLR